MAEQSGRSVAALQARLNELACRYDAIAEADRRLTGAVSAAHGAAGDARAALDRIEAEIETAVAANADPDARSLCEARELQRFLVDKQHEILAVVRNAQSQASAETAVLQELLSVYTAPSGGPAG